jgi:hypothetical protein
MNQLTRSALCTVSVWCFSIYTQAQSTGNATANVSTDVTNVNTVLYNADNRNSRPGDVSRQLDDNWGAVYNRLNAQAAVSGFRVAVRVDGAWFYTAQSPVQVGLNLLDIERQSDNERAYSPADADFFVNKFYEAGVDRNTRFTDWLYPAKYTLSYTTPDYDITAGDFYAQFGRGLVLNVRKQDELSSDTTIRGVRLEGKTRLESWRLKLNAVAGNLNPLRLDAASGRFLGV